MGYNVCRYVLLPSASKATAEAFAKKLCLSTRRLFTIYYRDLDGSSASTSAVQEAQAASVRILDIAPFLPFEELKELGLSSLGADNFLLRVADDDELDLTYPSSEWLNSAYPQSDLRWLLHPDEDLLPWNTSAFYVCPNNPADWGPEVPVALSLLSVALPKQPRPCPLCKTTYTTKGERGQCNECGFVAQPFRTKAQAKTISSIFLDASAWGDCPRCRSSHEFVHQVEQCFCCGQLLEGNPGRHVVPLQKNKDQIMELLKQAGILKGNFLQTILAYLFRQ